MAFRTGFRRVLFSKKSLTSFKLLIKKSTNYVFVIPGSFPFLNDVLVSFQKRKLVSVQFVWYLLKILNSVPFLRDLRSSLKHSEEILAKCVVIFNRTHQSYSNDWWFSLPHHQGWMIVASTWLSVTKRQDDKTVETMVSKP